MHLLQRKFVSQLFLEVLCLRVELNVLILKLVGLFDLFWTSDFEVVLWLCGVQPK
jgi:hypothetical protein